MLKKLWNWFSLNIISLCTWNGAKALLNGGIYYDITESEQDRIRKLLVSGYYIILTRRKTHLTTYLIALGTWIKTGKLGYWSHGLMNLEDSNVHDDQDYRLMEATGIGVHYSTFMQVFDCDSVVLMKPKGFTIEDWTVCLDQLKKQEGKPYDTLFDLAQDNSLSCVELVRIALQASPNYLKEFSKFEAMVQSEGKVIPQMLYDCGDFDVVYEVRH